MALVMADHRLFAAPDQRDGVAQLPGRQGQQMLDREVFASAKGSADGGIAHDHLIFWQFEHGGDLAAILVQPLPAVSITTRPRVVEIGNAGLWLQEGMLLPGGGKGLLQHDIGLGKARA